MKRKQFGIDRDYDALALEYRTATPERRSEIRALFQEGFADWADRILRARMHYCSVPESRHAEAQDLLDPTTFHEAGYAGINRKWDPDGGMPFENYYKRAIMYRCLRVATKMKANQIVSELTLFENDDIPMPQDNPPVEGECPPHDAATHLREKLLIILNALEKESGRGNPDLGKQARAVYELIHKADFDPDGMGTFTLQTVNALGKNDDTDGLKCAYHQCAIALTSLKDSMDAVFAEIERLRGRESVLAENLRGASDNRHNQTKREQARKALWKKRKQMQVLRERLAKYGQLSPNSEWVRPEEEVAQRLGMSQPTVHRRLEFAKDFIRNNWNDNWEDE